MRPDRKIPRPHPPGYRATGLPGTGTEQGGTGSAIALVPARGDLALRYARLGRRVQDTFGIQIRMTPLPGRLTQASRLVDRLAR